MGMIRKCISNSFDELDYRNSKLHTPSVIIIDCCWSLPCWLLTSPPDSACNPGWLRYLRNATQLAFSTLAAHMRRYPQWRCCLKSRIFYWRSGIPGCRGALQRLRRPPHRFGWVDLGHLRPLRSALSGLWVSPRWLGHHPYQYCCCLSQVSIYQCTVRSDIEAIQRCRLHHHPLAYCSLNSQYRYECKEWWACQMFHQ